MMRKLLIFAGVFLFMCMPLSAESGITQLTDNDYRGYQPQINFSGQVVCFGYGPKTGIGRDILLYDGTKTRQLTENDYDDRYPQINDSGQVVWEGYGPNGEAAEIFLYDGTQTIRLTNNDYADYDPQINDSGQVVWERYDGTDSEIFFYDGTETHQLTENDYDGTYPQINDSGQVVWSGWGPNGGPDIFLYDGTMPPQQLTDSAYYYTSPSINNSGQVLWYIWNSTSYGIFLYDGAATHKLTDTASLRNSYYSKVSKINDKGQVAWERYDGTDSEIFFYDGTTTQQLTDNDYEDYDPQINASGQVVWMGGGPNGTDREIFFYDGTTTHQLTDSAYYYSLPSINASGQAVWDDDAAILLYTPEPLSPTPDIKANGSDGPLTISQSDTLSVKAQLNAGSMAGQPADWWVVAKTPLSSPDDWYYFDLSSGWMHWMPGKAATYQGPLFNLNLYEVLNTSGLPLGTYTLYFGVDINMNGELDMDQAYYDSVEVTIIP